MKRRPARPIEVKGEAARDVELKFTRHGPVILSRRPSNRAFAVRSVWLEPGIGAYFGSIGLHDRRRT